MSTFLSKLVIRNPRNLEKLRFQRKPVGFEFEKDRLLKTYYYRAELELSKSKTTGLLRHHSEGVVLTACTSEWPIARRLYSNVDVCAAENIGRILAHRCLQSGITAVLKGADEKTSDRLNAFYEAMQATGVDLQEEDFLVPNADTDRRYHWEYKMREDKMAAEKPESLT